MYTRYSDNGGILAPVLAHKPLNVLSCHYTPFMKISAVSGGVSIRTSRRLFRVLIYNHGKRGELCSPVLEVVVLSIALTGMIG